MAAKLHRKDLKQDEIREKFVDTIKNVSLHGRATRQLDSPSLFRRVFEGLDFPASSRRGCGPDLS